MSDTAPRKDHQRIQVGDRVRHRDSNWAGPVTVVQGGLFDMLVTVRPDHPRPKEVYVGDGFVPTPDDWPGWAPITVYADELEKV